MGSMSNPRPKLKTQCGRLGSHRFLWISVDVRSKIAGQMPLFNLHLPHSPPKMSSKSRQAAQLGAIHQHPARLLPTAPHTSRHHSKQRIRVLREHPKALLAARRHALAFEFRAAVHQRHRPALGAGLSATPHRWLVHHAPLPWHRQARKAAAVPQGVLEARTAAAGADEASRKALFDL